VIIHERHDGTYEVIETIYDPVANTVTFTTDSFSNYAIASRTAGSPDTGFLSSDSPSAGAANSTVDVIAFSAIVLTAAAWFTFRLIKR